MKKGIISKITEVCISAASILSIGCTSAPAASAAASQQPSLAAAAEAKNAIQIEDIDWKAEPGIVDDNRCISLNYTNHSSYTIMEMKIRFKLKAALTDEQRALFNDIKEKNEFIFSDEEDYTNMYLVGDNKKFADPGETVSDSPIGINGWLYAIDTDEQYQLFQPDIMTLIYIGDDGAGHGMQYDFKNQSYGTYSGQSSDLHQWGNGDLAKLLPQHDFRVTTVSTEKDDYYEAYAYGADVSEYNAYIEEVQKNGFDEEVSNYFPYFSAKNKDGIKCSVTIWANDETIMIIVSKDE